jgi:hypothetical protein
MLCRLIHRLAWRHLPKWLAWRLTVWRSWGGEWPQHDFDWYNYALLGLPPVRREITLRHWAGEEDADLARRFGISQNEVMWHYGMASGHIEAILEAKRRRDEDRMYLALVNRDYPAGRVRMPEKRANTTVF